MSKFKLNDADNSTVNDHVVDVQQEKNKIKVTTSTTTETFDYNDKDKLKEDLKTLNKKKSEVLTG